MYALADMYFLDDLKLLSEAKFRQKLKKAEIDDEFAECVREVYAITSENDDKFVLQWLRLLIRKDRS